MDKVTAVDCHAHIFEKGLKLTGNRRYTPGYDATLEDYLTNLDANGCSHGVLVQPSFLGTDNNYLIAAIQRHARRLRGIAVIEPPLPADRLKELAGIGIVGIRLNLVGAAVDPDLHAAPWRALLRALADLDWLVEVQTEAWRLSGIVEPLLQSGVRVVVDHFGRPHPGLGVEDPGFRYLLSRGETRRVWVKLSGAYRNGKRGHAVPRAAVPHAAVPRAAMPLLRDAFGFDRLVWGSDWPHTQFETVVDYASVRACLDVWIPEVENRRQVLVDTPIELFHFQVASPFV